MNQSSNKTQSSKNKESSKSKDKTKAKQSGVAVVEEQEQIGKYVTLFINTLLGSLIIDKIMCCCFVWKTY